MIQEASAGDVFGFAYFAFPEIGPPPEVVVRAAS
jgi:hypothetical protein